MASTSDSATLELLVEAATASWAHKGVSATRHIRGALRVVDANAYRRQYYAANRGHILARECERRRREPERTHVKDRAYYHRTRERRLELNRRWRAAHREEAREHSRQSGRRRRAQLKASDPAALKARDHRQYERNKDYQKAYREAHREKVMAYQKAYREAHREQAAEYRRAHRDEIRAYHRAWREANRERLALRRQEEPAGTDDTQPCRRGHPANWWRKGRYRQCRDCQRERMAAARARAVTD